MHIDTSLVRKLPDQSTATYTAILDRFVNIYYLSSYLSIYPSVKLYIFLAIFAIHMVPIILYNNSFRLPFKSLIDYFMIVINSAIRIRHILPGGSRSC